MIKSQENEAAVILITRWHIDGRADRSAMKSSRIRRGFRYRSLAYKGLNDGVWHIKHGLVDLDYEET